MDTKENRGTDLNAGPAKAYQLLRAFLDEGTLAAASATLEASGYRTHEFGDSVLVEKQDRAVRDAAGLIDPRKETVATAA